MSRDRIRVLLGLCVSAARVHAGQLYGIHPNCAIYVGRSQNVAISDNTAAPGRVTKTPIAVDSTFNRVRVAGNVLRG